MVALIRSRQTYRASWLLKMSVALLLYAAVFNEVTGTTQLIALGFYTFHVVDLPILLIFVFCVFNFFRIVQLSPYFLWLLMLGSFLVFINFLRGLFVNSADALLLARSYLPLAVLPAAACLTRDPKGMLDGCKKYAIQVSVILAILVFLRVATRPDLFMITEVSVGDVNDGGRGLSAEGAVAILYGLWLTTCGDRPNSIEGRFLVYLLRIVFISAIFLSKQGTVGIAGAVTLLCYGLLFYKPARPLTALALPAIVVGGYISFRAGAAYLFGSDFVEHRLSNVGTRQAVWSAFYDQFSQQDMVIKLFGWPFGATPPLQVMLMGHTQVWAHILHSMYYGSLRIMGYSGIIVFFGPLLLATLSSTWLFLRRGTPGPLAGALILMSGFIYFYSYEVSFSSSFLLFWPILILRSEINLMRQQIDVEL